MAYSSKSVVFNNGLSCPILGFGTAKCDGPEGIRALKFAIDAGFRHIDCAHFYKNEVQVGQAIREKIEDGTVKRSDLFVTSKLWNSFHRTDMVKPALMRSLKDLGLEYLDLYLIHWPMAYKDGWEMDLQDASGRVPYSDAEFTDTWKVMETLVKEGLVRSIGISNFNKEQIQRLLTIAEIKPVTNQVECHPYLNQSKLLEFCKSVNIPITAYRAVGLISNPSTAFHDPVIHSLAEKYKKTTAQIMIKFQIQRGVIAIVKSMNDGRIMNNFDVFGFQLSTEDMQAISDLDKGHNGRQIKIDNCRDHRNYPFNSEF